MDRSKRFTNFFHNFVVMKKSVNFLPENKRNDLKQLVDLVRRNIKDVGMVILYGSYARNTYVDYDQRIEFGVPTYFMSDYDILILTRKPIGAIEYSLYDKIADAFFQHKTFPYEAPIYQLRDRRLQLCALKSPLFRNGDKTTGNYFV